MFPRFCKKSVTNQHPDTAPRRRADLSFQGLEKHRQTAWETAALEEGSLGGALTRGNQPTVRGSYVWPRRPRGERAHRIKTIA